MIVTFKSKAAADVIMFGDVAHELMKVMGKDPDAKGILTVEQLPDAIAALRAAAAHDKQAGRGGDDEDTPPMAQRVGIAQRAVPLLELMERSLKKNTPVVWGV